MQKVEIGRVRFNVRLEFDFKGRRGNCEMTQSMVYPQQQMEINRLCAKEERGSTLGSRDED